MADTDGRCLGTELLSSTNRLTRLRRRSTEHTFITYRPNSWSFFFLSLFKDLHSLISVPFNGTGVAYYVKKLLYSSAVSIGLGYTLSHSADLLKSSPEYAWRGVLLQHHVRYE